MFPSTLNVLGYREAKPYPLGIQVLVLTALVMSWLASRKRQLAAITLSAPWEADAAESALCGNKALVALAGLNVKAIWVKSWADPLTALALTALILRERWEATHTSRLGCSYSDH